MLQWVLQKMGLWKLLAIAVFSADFYWCLTSTIGVHHPKSGVHWPPKSVYQAWKMCTALTAAQMSTVCTVCSGQPANDKNRNHSAWTKRLDIQVDVQVYYKTSSPIVQSISTITVFPASKLAVIISFKTIKNCLAVSTNSLRLKDSIPLFWLEV